jgi:KDO2-lipid IV(A) lauroyltransferase
MAGLLCALPYHAALGAGWMLARASYLPAQKKIQEARNRVRQVFGDRYSEQQIRRMVWVAWRNTCFNAVEMIRTPIQDLEWVKRVTDYTQLRNLTGPLDQGRHMILAVPHMGSWEVAGVAMARFGLPLMLIVRTQKNQLFNDYLNRMRAHTGQTIFDRDDPGLVKKVLRGIRDGKILTILPDIRARSGGVTVPFLGGTATVGAGTAVFSRLTGTSILPAYVIRKGWTRHIWRSFEEIHPDPSASRDADIERITREVMAVFDRVIREYPAQYFWFNKKWLLDP